MLGNKIIAIIALLAVLTGCASTQGISNQCKREYDYYKFKIPSTSLNSTDSLCDVLRRHKYKTESKYIQAILTTGVYGGDSSHTTHFITAEDQVNPCSYIINATYMPHSGRMFGAATRYSCVDQDGKYTEKEMYGTVVGSDYDLGIPMKLVDKEKSLYVIDQGTKINIRIEE